MVVASSACLGAAAAFAHDIPGGIPHDHGVAAGGVFGPPVRLPSAERVLYIRGEFNDVSLDNPAAGITDQLLLQRAQTINATAEDYWRFNSYGRITEFDADFTELLQAPISGLDPDNQVAAGASAFGIRQALVDAAIDAGHDVASYDQIVLLFPNLPQFPAGALGTPGTVWLPGQNPFDGGLIHEFGHAFGLGHASTIEGGQQTLPGDHREGRDGLFMLGSEGGVVLSGPNVDGRRAPISLAQRYQAGFVEQELINQVDESGVYRIHAFDREDISGDAALGRSLAAAFETAGGEWFVSFAPGLADLWANFNGEGFANGAIVHQVEGAITRSLDFTPGSQGGFGTNTEDFVDTRDGALVVGQSFLFPGAELSLTTLAAGVSDDGVPYLDVRLLFANQIGDFTMDNTIDGQDFAVLVDNLFTDLAGLTAEEAFSRGDITGDLRVDFDDFRVFRDAFESLNGNGAFSRLLTNTPEPGSFVLAASVLLVATGRRLGGRRARAAA